SNSGPIWPVLPFYDISRTRMHLGELKKMRAVAVPRYGPDKVTCGGGFPIRGGLTSLTNRKIVLL
ncbi:MAG: hypothetical protein ACJ8EK_12750, partial [Bradyrhizobium sp.]